jgi:predicted AAA+ superfamily ATPase
VVAAGSLLEFTLADFPYSMPVGRIEYFHLGPMNFREYLMAHNEELLLNELARVDLTEIGFQKLKKSLQRIPFCWRHACSNQ